MDASPAKNDMTVLVATCDEYADLVSIFIRLFRRYWPDCPYEVVQSTETAAEAGFDRVVKAGAGRNWSERLANALDNIDTPYVLLLLDDYLLSGEVDTSLVRQRLDEAKRADALNYRLCPDPPRAVKNTAYSISCKVGIWNRDFLRSLVARTGSAWEFERFGSFMFDESDPRPIMVSGKCEFPFVDAVHKGYWEKCAVELLARNSIRPDFSRRGFPPLKVRVVEGLKKLAFMVFPADTIVRIQNALARRAK